MKRIFNSEILERLLFTVVALGIIAALAGGARIAWITNELNHNIAEQVHRSGEQLNIQSTAEGRGMVAADLERRELLNQRSQMMVVGGVGLALVGLGWLGYDLLRSRRKAAGRPSGTTDG